MECRLILCGKIKQGVKLMQPANNYDLVSFGNQLFDLSLSPNSNNEIETTSMYCTPAVEPMT